ncbi:MAG TPA: acyltransferase [Micromonospora sp.]|nr:acyltransferase [Micromonospora sp.]
MRNRYIDLLRSLAIVRVVVYHTTNWAFLTLVFPAMAVMFALAGSLMAASLDRADVRAVARRLRRLLPSLWAFAAIMVPAMLLLTELPVSWRLLRWLLPVASPPSDSWGSTMTGPVWYLRDYLWFVLASPLALWLFRRWPIPTVLAPYLLLVVVELRVPDAPLVLREFGLYFGAWLLGFAHHDGMLRRMARRMLLPLAGVLATLGGAWIFTHPGSNGYDLNGIRLGNGLWSAAFILLLLGLAPAGAAWVDRYAPLSRAVTLLNRRALTVYLWHMPIVVGLAMLTGAPGWKLDPVGLTVRLAVVAALIAVVIALFGWVEDLAARRRPELLPAGRPASGSGDQGRLPGPRRPADEAAEARERMGAGRR